MEFILKAFAWLASNFEMFISTLGVLVGALVVVVESINKLLGGKETGLTKIGKFLVVVGEFLSKVLSFIKLPKSK